MQWNELFDSRNKPDQEAIAAFIETPLWGELCRFLETTYSIAPSLEHSICSMQPGWNIKYKKGSKAICTVYPASGYFTCMIVMGSKEATEAEFYMRASVPELYKRYESVKPFNGTRWLMIDVTAPEILQAVENLILLKVPPKKK